MPAFSQRSFDVRPQQRLIRKRGTCVQWEKVMQCTCTDNASRADPNCEACHGNGYLVVATKTIRGLITQAMSNRTLAQAGIVQSGDLMFSQIPVNDCEQIHNQDRIILTEFSTGEPFDGEHIIRGTSNRDDLSYIVAKVGDVIVADEQTGAIEHYIEGTDFTIDRDDIVWSGTHTPATGVRYFIKYTARFEYVAFEPPFLRYEGTTNLGQRVLLRRRQFIDEPNPVADQVGIIVPP
jgi:hypothetical protein